MVVIPAGEFHNGIAAGRVERSNDESPQRRVTIAKPFAVGNEVTSLQPPQELRRADVVPTGHVEQNDPGLQRLGDDGHFVRPLATPLDATWHLDPSRPMGFGDITSTSLWWSRPAAWPRRLNDPSGQRHVWP